MADRPTASTITDDQLEALYAELDRYVLREIDRTDGEQDQRLAGHGVLHGLAGVARRRTEQRDRARRVAVALENENARLEAEAEEHRQAHEEETANTAREIARAERAEQQLAQHAALLAEYVHLADITHKHAGRHDCLGANHGCAGCDLRDRARTTLDGAQQPVPAAEHRPVNVRACSEAEMPAECSCGADVWCGHTAPTGDGSC